MKFGIRNLGFMGKSPSAYWFEDNTTRVAQGYTTPTFNCGVSNVEAQITVTVNGNMSGNFFNGNGEATSLGISGTGTFTVNVTNATATGNYISYGGQFDSTVTYIAVF